MKKQKVNVFFALNTLKKELSKLIPLNTVELSFRSGDDNKETLSATVHYSLPDKSSNFTVTLYEFDSNKSFEELIQRCRAQIATINPVTITELTMDI